MVATKLELCTDWLYYRSLATQFLSHCAQFYNSIPISSLLLNLVFPPGNTGSSSYKFLVTEFSSTDQYKALFFFVLVYRHLISCIEDAWTLDLQPAALQPMHNKPYLVHRRHIATFFLGAIDSSTALCLRAVSNNEVINNNTKMQNTHTQNKNTSGTK